MKRPLRLWLCLSLFVSLVGIRLWTDLSFPFVTYEYHYTGQVLDYFDRGAGRQVEAVPISQPDNPTWLNGIRNGWVNLLVTVLFVCVLYFEVNYRQNRSQSSPLELPRRA